MRFKLAKLPAVVIAIALAPGAIALAQNSVVDPGAQTSTPQVAQPEEGGVNWEGVGVGAGTIVGNVFYMPAKLAYGLVGGIAGGTGWALTGGNKQVADTIWRSSLGGDYILTPDMIKGTEPVHFSGPTQTAPVTDNTGAVGPNASTNVASANLGTATSWKGAGTTSSLASTSLPATDPSALSGTHPIDSGAGPVPNALRRSGSAVPIMGSESGHSIE